MFLQIKVFHNFSRPRKGSSNFQNFSRLSKLSQPCRLQLMQELRACAPPTTPYFLQRNINLKFSFFPPPPKKKWSFSSLHPLSERMLLPSHPKSWAAFPVSIGSQPPWGLPSGQQGPGAEAEDVLVYGSSSTTVLVYGENCIKHPSSTTGVNAY